MNPQLRKRNSQGRHGVNPKLIKELTFHGRGACVSFQGTFKCGHWPVYEMALHVVLLQGLGALTNDATAKLWENHTAPAPGCHQANRPSSGQRREGLGVERPPFCPWGAQMAGVFSCIYKCHLVRLQHVFCMVAGSPRPVGSTLWGFHPGLSVGRGCPYQESFGCR